MSIYIRKRFDQPVALECAQERPSVTEVSIRQQTEEKLVARAFYIDSPIGYMGVHSSPEGPILFANGEKYRFQDTVWRVQVTEGRTHNKFSLTVACERRLHFKYARSETDPWGLSSSPESDDFYLWLSKARSNAEFAAERTTASLGGEFICSLVLAGSL